MPVTKSGKRALRRARRQAKENQAILKDLRKKLKAARKTKTTGALSVAFSALDRAAKRNVIHKNKAARLKSRLAKLLPKTDGRAKPLKKKPTTKQKKA